MKRLPLLWAILMLLIAASLHAQVDFTECEKVTAPWKAVIDEYNAAHKAKGDGFQIEAGCMWSNPEPVKPKIKYPISASEALVLHRLREASYRAFRAMNAYQDYLLAAHGHPNPDGSTSIPPNALTGTGTVQFGGYFYSAGGGGRGGGGAGWRGYVTGGTITVINQ